MKTLLIGGDITPAAELLREGGLVAVPTETVYGLAGNGLDASVIERIYEVKGRPAVKPISLMVANSDAIADLCETVPQAARDLAERFWPGPLTLVLKAKARIPEILRAGGETVGLRCPRQQQTLQLLQELPFPLAVPSANPSGLPSPKTAGEVLRYFDSTIEGVIDGGPCELGLESTVLDLSRTPYRILRQGSLPAEEIAAAMLQRQQASAIIAARAKIVDGAVSMVKMAIDKLNDEDIVDLDEERKAQRVSNLLVVLCGNKDAQPIVNSGSIY